MVLNPCPSMTLQTGVKVVAAVDAVLYFIHIVYTGFSIYVLDKEVEVVHGIVSTIIMENVLIATVILYIVAFLAAFVLYFGARQNKSVLCWSWIGYIAVLRCLLLINDVFIFMGAYGSLEDHTVGGTEDLFVFAIELYFMYVVFAFIQHLRQVDDDLAELTHAGAHMYPQWSAIAQESAVIAQQPESPAELSPVI